MFEFGAISDASADDNKDVEGQEEIWYSEEVLEKLEWVEINVVVVERIVEVVVRMVVVVGIGDVVKKGVGWELARAEKCDGCLKLKKEEEIGKLDEE